MCSGELRPLNDTTDAPSSPRSIDDVIENAYSSSAINGSKAIMQNWRFYIMFFALGLANSADSAEMGSTGSVMASSQFQQDILQGNSDAGSPDFAWRGAAIASAHLGGMLISGLLAGVLADVWGRRSTLLLGLACNSLIGILSSMARTATELIFLRFCCGVMIGLVIAGVVTLSAEVSPPSKRGRFMSLVASCYTLGYLYISLWAMVIFQSTGSGNWRMFVFVNALPSMLAFAIAFFHCPESPRFFLSKGMLKEAAHVTNAIASKIGSVEKYTEQELRKYLFQAKALGRASILGKDAMQHGEEEDDIKSLPQEFIEKLLSLNQVYDNGMYKYTVPLQLAYIFLTLTTGANFWWTKIFMALRLPIDPFAMSFMHTLSQIPAILLATYLIDKIGRRGILTMGCSIMCVMLFLLSRIINNHNSEESTTSEALIILTLANLNTVGLALGWLGLDCLCAESFPTVIRSTGSSVCKATGRVFGFLVQFVYGPLISKNHYSWVVGVGCIFAAAGLLASFQTFDTLNIDLNDHLDPAEAVKKEAMRHEKQSKRASIAKKYFAIEV